MNLKFKKNYITITRCDLKIGIFILINNQITIIFELVGTQKTLLQL